MVKEKKQEVNQLNRDVRREQYLVKKTARVAERLAEEKKAVEDQVLELKSNNAVVTAALHREQQKNKREVLADHLSHVRSLQKKEHQLEESVDSWAGRFVVVVGGGGLVVVAVVVW